MKTPLFSIMCHIAVTINVSLMSDLTLLLHVTEYQCLCVAIEMQLLISP